MTDRPFGTLDGYLFRVTSHSHSSIHWVCRNRQNCRGRLKSLNEFKKPSEVLVCEQHDPECKPDVLEAERDYALGCMIYLARENPTRPVKEIFEEVMGHYWSNPQLDDLKLHLLEGREINLFEDSKELLSYQRKGVRPVKPSHIRKFAEENSLSCYKPSLPATRPETLIRHDFVHLMPKPGDRHADDAPLLCYDGRIFAFVKTMCHDKTEELRLVWECRNKQAVDSAKCLGCLRTDVDFRYPQVLKQHSDFCKPEYKLTASIYELSFADFPYDMTEPVILLGYRDVDLLGEKSPLITASSHIKITQLSPLKMTASNATTEFSAAKRRKLPE
ncbi:hypothetical protein Ciccas_014492 [Cichlidogyrus casuarinus]|uniref:FLYWCH-type domain-containing protein n=1 Tax=Cichlidogyrus casuarinus TaxID=1844966 RepID=A0ABD2PIQ1_9PLAT